MNFPNKMNSKYFRGFGFTPSTIIDVGVLHGTPFLYKAYPNAKFVLIDPLEESRDSVNKKWAKRIDYDFVVSAVGAEEGSTKMNVVTNRPAFSGINNRLDRMHKNAEQRTVRVRKLDQIVGDYPAPFGLKVDTEGHELSVLQGATETLQKCEFVILEVRLKQTFENSYLFSDIISIMADNGMQVCSFLSGFGRAPALADILFVPTTNDRVN